MSRTLADQSTDLRTGTLTVEDYLGLLEAQVAAREPIIYSLVPEPRRFERLEREARALLEHYPDPQQRPPLFGVSVGVKDIFHVDTLPTHAGSQLPPDTLRGPQSTVVTALKEAGALILGKTVTTEFAYFGPGPTRNPHNPFHTPGGSSSGSAAAVAAGLTPLALGTQTIGSINRPAAFCGVVGYKPSYGRISAAGVIPLARSLDHIGTFTPTAADAALAASLLVNEWQAPAERNNRPVLGVPDGPFLDHADDIGRTHFEETAARLEAAGFPVRRVAVLLDFEEIAERHRRLMAFEATHFHAAWYAKFGHLYHPKSVALIEQGRGVPTEAADTARADRARVRAELEGARREHDIDYWISPSAVGAAPAGLASTGDPIMNLPFTNAGLPTVTLPSGAHDGLPLGLQVAGGWYGDEALLRDAQAIESALQQKT